ncbi:hypothetical protein TWF281_001485 [Arthrobotrys megalospora]
MENQAGSSPGPAPSTSNSGTSGVPVSRGIDDPLALPLDNGLQNPDPGGSSAIECPRTPSGEPSSQMAILPVGPVKVPEPEPRNTEEPATPKELKQTANDIVAVQTGSDDITAPRVPATPQRSRNQDREMPNKLKTSSHIFDPQTNFRKMGVHFIKEAGYVYQSTEKFRHRDYLGRVFEGPQFDRYLHHKTGKLRKLIVSCTDDIYQGAGTSTWRRTYVRSQAGLKVRIATWVVDYSKDPNDWETWFTQLLKAFPAAFGMTFCFFAVGRAMGPCFGGSYPPVAYRYYGEAKVWSNQLENQRNEAKANTYQEYRVIKPRHLCFLKEPQDDELHGIEIWPVEDWELTNGGRGNSLSYVFIGYSTEHFNHDVEADMEALHKIAETAARAAGAIAYWLAGSCMREKKELVSDVYRIADVLRGAQQLIIALRQPKMALGGELLGNDDLLRSWGERMWTFPEVLLSPGDKIFVYTCGENLKSPRIISKNQFAGSVWGDADESRQLIDSYLGNLGLSRLEFATIAVGCLYRRQTTQYFPGDQAYALMGLLRLRPPIDKTDSQFQAFARLSLVNDSDMLLERYVCTLPLSLDQPWYDMRDAYGSSLWDIYPRCQVAAICEDDTIILDGAHAASIRWKSLLSVEAKVGLSLHRAVAILLTELNGVIFILACTLLGLADSLKHGPPGYSESAQESSPDYGSAQESPPDHGPAVTLLTTFGVIFLLSSIFLWYRSPSLIRTTYDGKFTYTQAGLFGIEGYLSSATVERAIFGGFFGRMKWSVNGSLLCRSYVNEHGERVGMDPTKDDIVREKVNSAKLAKPGQMRVFTLIDTYNMEVMLFEAIRPPTCLILGASEGGMQRAIGCSYDWTTQTMYRETVLRMPTMSLNRMDRIPRFRLGTRRPDWPCRELATPVVNGQSPV